MLLSYRYCGAMDSMEAVKHKDRLLHNGIDRVDNSKGYHPENCVPCCKTCNIAKQSMSVEEFLAWARRVIGHAAVI